jgi:hypothetical protein
MKSDAAETALTSLIDALATILIRLDITPGRVDQLARASFVRAGAAIAKKKSSNRPHLARIAALTGLTRLEVKRIIGTNSNHRQQQIDHLPRAMRVLQAWRTTAKYSRNGRALTLRFLGRPPSFEALCKEFSGDIPHKTIATDLAARGLLRIGKRRGTTHVSLLRVTTDVNPQLVDTLTYAATFLKSIAESDRVLIRLRQRVSIPETFAAAYFEDSIAARVAGLVDDLSIDTRRQRSKATRKNGLDVFAVVSRTLAGNG